jgi:hypothetical protein
MNRRSVALLALAPVFFLGVVSAQHIERSDLPRVAIAKSQITLPGSTPFHLRAKVYESTNLDNKGYDAEIEEWWLAPNKWRRTIKSAKFSQTLIVNGDRTSQELTGDYYPNWLRTIVDGINDPGASIHGVDMSASSDNPMATGAVLCRRFAFRAGIPPVQNNVFSSYCFAGDLLESVGKPGYSVDYQKYEEFSGKYVARLLNEYIEPGEEVGATIVELTELNTPDESLFEIERPSPELRTVIVSEQAVRAAALTTPAIEWPTIEGGKASGVLSIYVCIDREGHVREAYALNSDNPFTADAAREQISKWNFKPAIDRGVSVQMESILTFAYETKIVPKPAGSDSH